MLHCCTKIKQLLTFYLQTAAINTSRAISYLSSICTSHLFTKVFLHVYTVVSLSFSSCCFKRAKLISKHFQLNRPSSSFLFDHIYSSVESACLIVKKNWRNKFHSPRFTAKITSYFIFWDNRSPIGDALGEVGKEITKYFSRSVWSEGCEESGFGQEAGCVLNWCDTAFFSPFLGAGAILKLNPLLGIWSYFKSALCFESSRHAHSRQCIVQTNVVHIRSLGIPLGFRSWQ